MSLSGGELSQEDNEHDVDAARDLLFQRVREMLVNGGIQENSTHFLQPGDIELLRKLPQETIRNLIVEVVRAVRASQTEDAIEMPTDEVSIPALREIIEGYATREARLATIEQIAPAVIATHEISTDLFPVETEDDIIDLEKKEYSQEIRAACTDHALQVIQPLFDGMQHYTVFASTALYLQEKKIAQPGQNVQTTPGDLDVHMWSRKEFGQIRERLENVQHHEDVLEVHLSNDGKTRSLPGQSTEKLSGYIDMKNGEQRYRYHFEIFLNDQGSDLLFDSDLKKMTTTVHGLRTLTTEGLQRQYAKNLQMEYHVANAVPYLHELLTKDQSTVAVVTDAFEQWKKTGDWPTEGGFVPLVESLRVRPEKLAAFYVLNSAYQATPESNHQRRDILWTKITAILGAFKSKVDHRKEKISQLQKANRLPPIVE